MKLVLKALLIPTVILAIFTCFFSYGIFIDSQSDNPAFRRSASVEWWLPEYLIAVFFVEGIGTIYCYSELKTITNQHVEVRKK